MSDCISLYPMYNSDVVRDIFHFHSYMLNFTDEENAVCPLRLYPDEVRKNLFFIEDPDSIWRHEDYGFNVERTIEILDPSSLFGNNQNAIACSDASIGLAFQWSSKTSARKQTKKIGCFTIKDKNKEFKISEKFDKCQFRGEVVFSVFLYLEAPGTPQDGEELFINQQGYLLGELDSLSIQFDGNGSILPVFYEEVNGAALWHVNCNWSDPSSDSFSNPDIISISINKKNPYFKYVDKKSEAFNTQMANEMMASAISMIIESLRAFDGFTSLNNPENGSVSDAVRYFRDVLSWDLSTPITVNQNIREAFEKNN